MKTEYTSLPYILASCLKEFRSKGKGRPVTCQAGTWEGSGIALPTLDAGAGQRHDPSALLQKTRPLPILEEDRWVSGLILTDPQNLAATGVRSPSLPACSSHYTN
jgi:hypothetical protein